MYTCEGVVWLKLFMLSAEYLDFSKDQKSKIFPSWFVVTVSSGWKAGWGNKLQGADLQTNTTNPFKSCTYGHFIRYTVR